jgi:hypothetical protein
MAEDNSYDQPDVAAPEPAPAPIPDYMTDPDAVSKDEGVEWRFGKAPNYSNTRKVWAQGKHKHLLFTPIQITLLHIGRGVRVRVHGAEL